MNVKVKFVKDCGHRKEGSVDEFEYLPAQQYMASGFAEAYVEPAPEPPPAIDPGTDLGLSEKVVDALKGAGYAEFLDVLMASDEELLAIKGIGKAALEQIRALGEPVQDEKE